MPKPEPNSVPRQKSEICSANSPNKTEKIAITPYKTMNPGTSRSEKSLARKDLCSFIARGIYEACDSVQRGICTKLTPNYAATALPESASRSSPLHFLRRQNDGNTICVRSNNPANFKTLRITVGSRDDHSKLDFR